MKQINLFLIFLILLLALLPILISNRFSENIEYEFDAPIGLVYDEFYNLRQFSKWQQFTASDTLTVKKFSNTQESEENSMTWDSGEANIASGKIRIINFSVNRFINYTIKYDGWENLDSLNIKFTQLDNGNTKTTINYLSQKIPYFYRYFSLFKNPKRKFKESMVVLNNQVKLRLDKDKKEGKLNYGEYRIVELARTDLLAIRKQSDLAHKDVTNKIDAAFETIYKILVKNKGVDEIDFDLGFPYIYFIENDKDKSIFYAGIQLIEDLPPHKDLKKITVPGGQYLLTLHLGSRSSKKHTIDLMNNFAKSNKIKLGTEQLEVMLNEPKESDSLKLISRIYVPIIK